MCGGAEWVAVKIIETLKARGHYITVLTDESINYNKISKLLGVNLKVDNNLVFPFRFFANTDLHNVYTDTIRFLFLKSKSDFIIDTQSNAILPWVDMVYIHYPLFGRLHDYGSGPFRSLYYLPYQIFEKKKTRRGHPLILSNSKYTEMAVRNFVGATSQVLYPPIPESFFTKAHEKIRKEDLVVSFARLSPEKRLTTVPYVASLTNNSTHFLIIGTKESPFILNEIKRLSKEYNVTDRVTVKTCVPLEDARQILRRAKIFFHPGVGEHFGITIVEAMASGCIPIVHNSGGPKYFVPDAFRFETSESAAKKIEKSISEWSPKTSRMLTNMAYPFNENIFSQNFQKIFNAQTYTKA